MGIFDKIKGMVGSDDLDYNEYDNDLFGDDMPMQDNPSMDQDDGYDASMNFEPAQERQQQQQYHQPKQPTANNSNLELKVVKPDRYENVNQIADHLLNSRTVVLNLEGINKETARRLIDFLSGVVYSIDGSLKRVANNTFVITPGNVVISGDQMRSAQQQAPQPQNNDPYSDF